MADEPFGRAEVLAGLTGQRAHSLLFAIEQLSVEEEANRLQTLEATAPGWAAEEGERDFLEAFRRARIAARAATIHDIEHQAARWAHLVPAAARTRASLAQALGAKYQFTRRSVPGIRKAMDLDSEEVQASFRAIFGKELESIYVPDGRISVGQLTIAFLSIGVTTFGRATTFFPELVQRRGWLAPEDYVEGYTLAKLLPGPTALNMTAYFGLALGGLPVALYGAFLFALPGALMVFVLSAVMFSMQFPTWVYGGLAGGAAAALGVLLLTGVQMAESARKARFWYVTLGAAFLASAVFDLSFPLVLLTLGTLSLLANLPRGRSGKVSGQA